MSINSVPGGCPQHIGVIATVPGWAPVDVDRRAMREIARGRCRAGTPGIPALDADDPPACQETVKITPISPRDSPLQPPQAAARGAADRRRQAEAPKQIHATREREIWWCWLWWWCWSREGSFREQEVELMGRLPLDVPWSGREGRAVHMGTW